MNCVNISTYQCKLNACAKYSLHTTIKIISNIKLWPYFFISRGFSVGLLSFYIDSNRIKENRICLHLRQWSREFTFRRTYIWKGLYNLGAPEILQHWVKSSCAEGYSPLDLAGILVFSRLLPSSLLGCLRISIWVGYIVPLSSIYAVRSAVSASWQFRQRTVAFFPWRLQSTVPFKPKLLKVYLLKGGLAISSTVN